MHCLHSSFTLCPDPWVFERAGVFTPGLWEDWSVSGRGVGVQGVTAEDAEGQGVSASATWLPLAGSVVSPRGTCLSLSEAHVFSGEGAGHLA